MASSVTLTMIVPDGQVCIVTASFCGSLSGHGPIDHKKAVDAMTKASASTFAQRLESLHLAIVHPLFLNIG
jgi:hypothetical protein